MIQLIWCFYFEKDLNNQFLNWYVKLGAGRRDYLI